MYKSKSGPAVLAPVGWKCFGYYGSGGAHLNVTPATADPKAAAADLIIQAWLLDGETSGRFTVADIVARVFPAFKSFVQHVAAERATAGLTFPTGPFPADRLTQKSDRMVEFETPRGEKGLGTYFLTPNDYDARGVVVLTPESDVRLLQVRLAPDMNDIVPIIIQQFEAGQIQ